MTKELTMFTLENLVKGGYRFFCLQNIRTVPTSEEIFVIVIDILREQKLLEREIYSTFYGGYMEAKDIRLQDIESILYYERMDHLDLLENKERFAAQYSLIIDFDV